MSLGDCLIKAGKAFSADERSELIARMESLWDGTEGDRKNAEITAVKEKIAELDNERTRILSDARGAIDSPVLSSLPTKKPKGAAKPKKAAPVEPPAPTAEELAEKRREQVRQNAAANTAATKEIKSNVLTADALASGKLRIMSSSEATEELTHRSWKEAIADGVNIGLYNPCLLYTSDAADDM
jgi:hypothetical protein